MQAENTAWLGNSSHRLWEAFWKVKAISQGRWKTLPITHTSWEAIWFFLTLTQKYRSTKKHWEWDGVRIWARSWHGGREEMTNYYLCSGLYIIVFTIKREICFRARGQYFKKKLSQRKHRSFSCLMQLLSSEEEESDCFKVPETPCRDLHFVFWFSERSIFNGIVLRPSIYSTLYHTILNLTVVLLRTIKISCYILLVLETLK